MKKTTIGLISKKATLHLQHTFFVRFFAVVLDDYNVKRPETSWLHVLWRKCRASSCSLSLIFTLAAASISHFLKAAKKIFMLFLQQNMSPCFFSFFFLTRSSSFLVELRLPVALLSLFLCLSLFSRFVDMTINLHLIL